MLCIRVADESPLDGRKIGRKDEHQTKESVEAFAFASTKDNGYDNVGKLYDTTDLSKDFEYLRPVFNYFIQTVCQMEPEPEDRVKAINRFLGSFKFSKYNFMHYCFCEANNASLTEDSEPYYNLVKPNNRKRFYDLMTERKTDDSGFTSLCLKKDDFVVCTFEVVSIENDVLYGHITVDPNSGRFRKFKDSTITAPAFITYLAPIESAVTMYECFAKDFIELRPNDYLTYSDDRYLRDGYVRLISETAVKDYEAELASCFSIVGTEEDFAKLDESLKHLKIYVDDGQKILIDAEAVDNQATSVVLKKLTASGDVVGTTKDYGVFMYLSWLAFSDFFLDSWRGFTAMPDWLKVIGQENVAPILRRLDTYAVIVADTGTYFATSVGFLHLVDGTIENPEVVEWLNLETMETMLNISSNKLTKTAYEQMWRDTRKWLCADGTERDASSSLSSGWNDDNFIYITQVLSYVYRKQYDLLDKEYNLFWLRRSYYLERFEYRDAGCYVKLHGDMLSNVTSKCLKSTIYKSRIRVDADPGRDCWDKPEVKTMCRIIAILHELFHSGYTVKICESCVGVKSAPVKLRSLEDVSESVHYKKLPKVRTPKEEWC